MGDWGILAIGSSISVFLRWGYVVIVSNCEILIIKPRKLVLGSCVDDQFFPGKVSLRKVATAVNVLQGLMDSSSSNLKWSISVPLALGKADRQYFCVSAQEIAGKLS